MVPRLLTIAAAALASSLLYCAPVTAAAPAPCGSSSTVTVVHAPWSDCLTPDGFFDAARNRLHVVYGTATKDAIYSFSDASGASFSTPINLNDAGLSVTSTMGETRPQNRDGRQRFAAPGVG